MYRRIMALATLLILMTGSLPTAAAETPAPGSKISAGLDRALVSGDALDQEGKVRVWVRFTDKNQNAMTLGSALDRAERELAPAARARRARAGASILDATDLPVAAAYLDGVTATGAVPRHVSRWLNAASFVVDPALINRIENLPYVAGLDLVGRRADDQVRMNRAELEAARISEQAPGTAKSFSDLDYGFSADGLDLVNVLPLHDAGLSGEGVVIAIFDTGFELTHESLQGIDVVAAYDFVDDDPIVSPEARDPVGMADHGSTMLSIMMGFSSGNLIGPAYGAGAILARTEDTESESPAEEDNWIAALEWAEGLGADVVCSAVGYYGWYDFSDLDGSTTAITVAAELASARGLCVVNNAGNERANPEWPHIIPPADGPSVIAVGSVDPAGLVTRFSSAGPTADGRIKPDVMALGDQVLGALQYVDGIYLYGQGTDLATATMAGVVALMIERNPTLTPRQLGEALRATGSRALNPDNDYGWGSADATAAAGYWTPMIAHTPLGNTEGGGMSYPVNVSITSRLPLDPMTLAVAWRRVGDNWKREILTPVTGDTYTCDLPFQPPGTQVEYYITAGNELGLTAMMPPDAPEEIFTFNVGTDTEPPVVSFFTLTDQTTRTWPPTLRVNATDNLGVDRVELSFSVNGGPTQGPYALAPLGDDMYALDFPTPPGGIFPGQEVAYYFLAYDQATNANAAYSGENTFRFAMDRGRVLLIDDRRETESSLAMTREWGLRQTEISDKATGADLAQWLTDAGWTVDLILAADVVLSSLQGYDAVFMTSGRNVGPLSYSELRQALLNWNEQGGHLLIESGELAYASEIVPSMEEIRTEILHIEGWASDEGRDLRIPPQLGDHPFHHRPREVPHELQVGVAGTSGYSLADVVWPDDEVQILLKSTFGTDMGGALVYDTDTGLLQGQTVYLTFDIGQMSETDGRLLLENTMYYLTGKEEPGPSQIAGHIQLAGQSDNSGVVVSCGPDHTAVTGPDGSYVLDGLWGSSYEISATKNGYAPAVRNRDLTDGEVLDGVDFYLLPVVEVNVEEYADLPIPDNNPEGITSLIIVPTQGQVGEVSVNIDISHYSIGNLVVTLTSPLGTSVTLHNQDGATNDDLVGNWPGTLFVSGPGSLDNFVGESALGPWYLRVADVAFGATGRLNSWGLDLLVTDQSASGVNEELPGVTRLVNNVPNPFNPSTAVYFELASAGPVQVGIYDLRGRLVAMLADARYPAGRHVVRWEGRAENGSAVASGVYFARMVTQEGLHVHKMTLVQ